MENKYFKSDTVELWRSEIHPSDYNPRKISGEAKKLLKRSVKTYGVVGGMVVNKQTGNTLVAGHQKLYILDELNKYEGNKDTDYKLKVELVDIDLKTEKELNITMNNPNVGGEWDYDLLREMIPDIDYKDAGLTEEDLSLIGIDFTFQTDAENELARSFDNLSSPVDEKRELEKQARKEDIAQKKQKILEGAEEKAKDAESYVMVNFDSWKSKADFMLRFGYNASDKFIQGEYLVKLIDELS